MGRNQLHAPFSAVTGESSGCSNKSGDTSGTVLAAPTSTDSSTSSAVAFIAGVTASIASTSGKFMAAVGSTGFEYEFASFRLRLFAACSSDEESLVSTDMDIEK